LLAGLRNLFKSLCSKWSVCDVVLLLTFQSVKLGTITSDGKADVFSYAKEEDNMVIDPDLKKHLAHFGKDVVLKSNVIQLCAAYN
jgi:hypothetical protein